MKHVDGAGRRNSIFIQRLIVEPAGLDVFRCHAVCGVFLVPGGWAKLNGTVSFIVKTQVREF